MYRPQLAPKRHLDVRIFSHLATNRLRSMGCSFFQEPETFVENKNEHWPFRLFSFGYG